jgi:DNA-binding transcriptional MerR regulator
MNSDRLSIEELADAAGLTRRGIRFYVQQGLIPAPHGVGRGKHYDKSHLEQLLRVRELQSSGHSLDEIRTLLTGDMPAEAGKPATSAVARAIKPALRAQLWRRLRINDGVELSFDAAKFDPSPASLMALKETIGKVFRGDGV